MGYSSFASLKHLDADCLKIDKYFIDDLLLHEDTKLLVSSMVDIGHIFCHKVIAEGVETLAHGVALLQLGCELAQGYGIARPMPADDIPDWISNWKADDSWQI